MLGGSRAVFATRPPEHLTKRAPGLFSAVLVGPRAPADRVQPEGQSWGQRSIDLNFADSLSSFEDLRQGADEESIEDPRAA